ncbi:hypothetical protein HMPREF0653_00876 [Prevotella disiens JCM 6334 = ATCC 29426]|uniref:Uncharacterized protein n=1 Tax=Prevotella disiens JCM 6334 = ATCC 29426 TaxID=1235811 RepID=A0ABN0NTR5_9BACT|nr:hypothetical protein HMPREF0653_00876 [Prevotella disiens JCM 6334 = ATCC 29426]
MNRCFKNQKSRFLYSKQWVLSCKIGCFKIQYFFLHNTYATLLEK